MRLQGLRISLQTFSVRRYREKRNYHLVIALGLKGVVVSTLAQYVAVPGFKPRSTQEFLYAGTKYLMTVFYVSSRPRDQAV